MWPFWRLPLLGGGAVPGAAAFPDAWAADVGVDCAEDEANDGGVDGAGCDGVSGACAAGGIGGGPVPLAGPVGVWAAASAVGDVSGNRLAAFHSRKRDMQRERDRLNADIKNAERKRLRLIERAKGLSDEDLYLILGQRAAANAKAAARALAKAAAAAAKAASAPPPKAVGAPTAAPVPSPKAAGAPKAVLAPPPHVPAAKAKGKAKAMSKR